MIERYTLPEMAELWSEKNKFDTWLLIELAVCEVRAARGEIPRKALANIKKRVAFDPQRIAEIEAEVNHDVIAFLTNIAENIGSDSKYIHVGLTSSDILDTALGYLMKQAGSIIRKKLVAIADLLAEKAVKYDKSLCIGRTHGVHAEPTVFGLKLALWCSEFRRDIRRLDAAIEDVAVGKLSGAVGNFAHIDPEIEEQVCRRLGLGAAEVSTQVIQRDRHAHFLATLAVIGGTVEKIATEIRNLQRTEILELEEGFGRRQKGSSAMPHKRNPVTCERLAGLARVIRANSMAAMENMALWHERDITHSSVERIIIPDSTTLLYYMLERLHFVLSNLVVNTDNMRRNLELTRGLIFSQRLLLGLTERMKTREAAYEAVQELAMKSWRDKLDFKEMVERSPVIRKYLKPREIEALFDYGYFSRRAGDIIRRAVAE
ncbi:MAG: adenylosuccinate lyase [candidate division Zixibacteria bacterium RBG_16_53_22]|nr:MAG: adenylosuccinate lyase [candidate division Zixibacteria bacterium RBG_16_53_22]